ncbi:23S rRNA pseudouridine1911/1915/1917 synthase [Candidatus Planktophila limnetica]|jgi:23S rRNA pseudouridine1911/1915/1917 synthase|uniref:Pseudouridine synthase n=1 Tax=Candidatus Planktophila limnetica TaxID=573600 RepID=A0A249LFE2_9ACTN|nr:RluA family pseudouridine synthase [Candidatus Planktophila limnetica]ASY27812.1 23S rRNA pseudouridine1911/1915/1917 synthase [Candidatus Planktophila limnetica]
MARISRTLSVPEGVAGERIDSALTRVLGLSRTAVVRLLEDGDITTSGKAMNKSDKVAAGQIIEVLMPQEKNSEPIPLTPIPGLSIIYNDDSIVVIDKPVGCAAHPSPGWEGPTVVGALSAAGYTISTSGPAERAGIVHRLDVGTSGLMVVAKTDQAYTFLKDAFKSRNVTKIYHALIQGHMDPSTGTIDAPIDRHPKEDHRFAVVANGKESITHYEVIEFYRGVSLVKVELETGRTHQIRVHFSALRHPLVGDLTYGADPALAASLGMSRPWLHAMVLELTHPRSGERLTFNAPYPADLTNALALLSSAVLP